MLYHINLVDMCQSSGNPYLKIGIDHVLKIVLHSFLFIGQNTLTLIDRFVGDSTSD